MKIGMTGHTRGVGKAIFDKISETHEVLGFSRTNGYDVSDPITIINEVIDCDVFINNAYNKECQLNLFTTLFDKWKDSEKIIINTLNFSTILDSNLKKDYENDYFTYKSQFLTELNNLYIQYNTKQCKVMNIFPSTLEGHESYPDSKNKVEYKDVANIVNWLIQLPKGLEVPHLSIRPTSQYKINNSII